MIMRASTALLFLLFSIVLTASLTTSVQVKIDDIPNDQAIPMMDPKLFESSPEPTPTSENSETADPTFSIENIKNFEAKNNIIQKAYEKCTQTCSITNFECRKGCDLLKLQKGENGKINPNMFQLFLHQYHFNNPLNGAKKLFEELKKMSKTEL